MHFAFDLRYLIKALQKSAAAAMPKQASKDELKKVK